MNYRDLKIFHLSKQLAIEVHNISLTFKKFELYEEGSQVRRSSKRVTAAIVEGYGRRRYKADFIKHLIYGLTECDETVLHLDFLATTKSCDNISELRRLQTEYDILSRKINKYLRWVEQYWNPNSGNMDDQ